MIAFICLFFPAVVSLWIYEAAYKHRSSVRQLVYRFCLNTVVINFICFLVFFTWLKTAENPLYLAEYDLTPVNAIIYTLISMPSAVIIGLVESVVSKNAVISVEEKADGSAK